MQTYKVVERPVLVIGEKGYAAAETIHFIGSEVECFAFLRELEKKRRTELEQAPEAAVAKILRTIFLVKVAWPTDRIGDRADE